MSAGAHPQAPEALEMRAEDWLLAAVLCLFPAAGRGLAQADALFLTGVAILIWTGYRAPFSERLRDAYRAAAVAGALVLLCLLLPKLDGTLLAYGTPLGLLAALACVLARGAGHPRPWLRGADRWTILSTLGVGAFALVLLARGVPLASLEPMILIPLVYAIYRLHLLRSRRLALLTRTTLYALGGALAVAGLG